MPRPAWAASRSEAIRIKAAKKARITPLKGFKNIVLGAAPAPKLTKAFPT